MQDRGEYQCIVVSPAGNSTASTFVETREPVPEITSTRNETVARGNLAFLHCRTQTLHATIQWLKGSTVVSNTAKTRLFPNGTLMIYDVNMQDSGAYRCRVQTSGGRAEAVMYLRVIEPPNVFVSPQSLYFVRGQPFNVSCTVAGDPPPEPQWFFKGRRIVPQQHKYYITYKYDLIVQRPTDADAGVYECRASNAAGTQTASVTAHSATSPKIRVTRDRQMIGRGDRVVLECIIEHGTPKPKVTWFRGGREVLSHRYITVDEGQLTIQVLVHWFFH
ncbi:unnamed protein product [Gongylonema pulchrum]|uniref:Ig-like domain-containing protein n=1 Tax=Gongylonema pulchrum TaxID=637853 RepID=A0A3P6PKU4_9BILA|nr:unnamed protein product [Gongylonema pulchrum]